MFEPDFDVIPEHVYALIFASCENATEEDPDPFVAVWRVPGGDWQNACPPVVKKRGGWRLVALAVMAAVAVFVLVAWVMALVKW